ncbi:MAG: RNA methyltransferase [Bacteroidia bacterium]
MEKYPIIGVLDNVRSMHNVGAIFRSADAFRVAKLYLCGITPTPPHREIHKTALGAEESVDWEYAEDTAALLQQLKENGCYIAALEQTEKSVSLPDFQLPNQPIVLVFGHEVEGVAQAAINLADVTLEIPQFGTKHSLNVSVAAGIALYQVAVRVEK